MSEAILCPQCEKRYKLPENPPATYTCTQCGTLIDLSAFGGGNAAAAGSPGPAAASKTGGERSSSRGGRSTRRAGGRGRGSAAPPPRQAAPKEKQPPILGIVIAVLVVAVLIAARSGGDDPLPRKKKKATPPPMEVPESTTPIRTPISTSKKAAEAKKNPKAPKVDTDGAYKLRLSRIELKPLDWPEGVSDEVKQRTEASIRAMYAGGREGVEAEAWLIEQGRPVAGRIISEFSAIQKSPGFDNRDGTSMAMQVDALLHKIDGFMERSIKETGSIKSTGFYAGISFITRTAKRWTWWWENEEWRNNPQPPWDPFEDESDETASGMKAPEKKKDSSKGSGFKKRAGG